MNARDWRRRCLRRDLAAAAIGLGIVAIVVGFTQTRWFYALVKGALARQVSKATIDGSTYVYRKDGRLSNEPSARSAPAVEVRWKASRQAIGKPLAPLWEQGAVEITDVYVNDSSTNEAQVRAFIEQHGLGPGMPGFVGARELVVDGKRTRVLFPTPPTEIDHSDRTLATFRANWLRAFRIACAGLFALIIASLLFLRTAICIKRSRRGHCVRCNYDRVGLPVCPECNLAHP